MRSYAQVTNPQASGMMQEGQQAPTNVAAQQQEGVKEVWCDPEDPRIAKGLERVSKEGMSPSMEAEIDRRAARLRERQAGRNAPKGQET